jgi:hypothetical protein
MGRRKSDQGQLFYEFRLGDAGPKDHLVRKTDAALDLSWLRSELTPHYSSMERRFRRALVNQGRQQGLFVQQCSSASSLSASWASLRM